MKHHTVNRQVTLTNRTRGHQGQMNDLKDQFKFLDVNELAAAFNQKFETSKETSKILAFLKNHGIKSGRTGQLVPTQKPWNA